MQSHQDIETATAKALREWLGHNFYIEGLSKMKRAQLVEEARKRVMAAKDAALSPPIKKAETPAMPPRQSRVDDIFKAMPPMPKTYEEYLAEKRKP